MTSRMSNTPLTLLTFENHRPKVILDRHRTTKHYEEENQVQKKSALLSIPKI